VELSERLRQLRGNKAQKDIAALLNVKPGTYSTYETGRSDVNSEQLIILSKYYGVSVDYILGIESDSDNQFLDELTALLRTLSVDDLKQVLNYAKFIKQQNDEGL